MSTCELETAFASLPALRAEHRRLQKIYRDHPEAAATFAQMESFIRRGVATGAILDDEHDQAAAQSLLDFWATTLYRAQRPVPESTLAPFDPELAPTLDESAVPYVGLDSFVEQKTGMFFGRQQAIDSLVSRLRHEELVAVIGPSGSGKSSLVLAGLIPALKAGALPGSERWTYLGRMVPGVDPLANLEQLIERRWTEDAATTDIPQILKADPAALLALLNERSDQPVVLVVDQFEEIATLQQDSEARVAFEKALAILAGHPDSRHIVLLTMRNDFIGAVAREPELQRLLENALEPVMPLTAAELRDAIERPAEKIGLKFEQGVVEALMHDILGEPAALPLLQFTLLQLWERREHNRVTLHAYRELGGGRLALTRSADKFMESLVPEDRVMADRIFMRLVRPGTGQDNVANRVRRQSLYNIGPCQHVNRVLDKLIEGRLIRLTGDSEADTEVEIAHEALVRNWDRLVMLLDRDRERITSGRRLEAKAAEWIRHGRGEAGLLKSVALLEAETWLGSPDAAALVSDDLRALVVASRTAANAAHRRNRRVRRVLVTLTCVSVALAGFALTGMVKANSSAHAARWNWDLASEETKKAIGAKELADRALIDARAAEVHADRARQEALDAKNRAEEASATAERRAGLIDAQKIQIEKLLEADRTKARLFDATSWAEAAKKSLIDDPEHSILLAVQAALLLEMGGQALPPSVASTLHQAIQANRLRLALSGSSEVVAVAFSPDSRRIATASPTRITISDAISGGRVTSFLAASPAAIAYSADGKQLAVAGKALQIVDPQTGATIRAFPDPSSAIDRLSFSPDGRYLAGIGAGGDVHLWALSGTAPRSLEHDKNSPVRAVAFSPTGALIASAGGGPVVKIWAAETGEHIANVVDQPGVTDLVFHPDGQRLITASEDRSVRVARPLPLSSRNSEADVARYELPTAVRAIGVSREGRVLAIGAEGIVTTLTVGPGAVRPAGTLVRTTGGAGSLTVAAQFALPGREAGAFRISPDGATLASIGSSSGVRLWNLEPGSGTILGRSTEPIASLSAVGRQAFVTGSDTGAVRLWSLDKPGREIVGAFEVTGARMAVVSPDGSRAAFNLCKDACRIDIYQTAARKLERTLPGTGLSDSLAFNHDGTLLASAGRDSVRLWDVSSGMPLGAPTPLRMSPARSLGQGVSAMVFSPDGQQLAIGLMDGKIFLAQLKDRVLQPPAVLASTSPVLGLAFSQDGRKLAAGHSDRHVRIWNLAGFDGSVRAPERTWSAHAGSVKALAFSAGGNLLATGSSDKTVRVWNLEAEQPDTDVVTSVPGLSGISEIRFTDDSAAMIVAADDGTVRLLPARLTGQLPSGLTALTRNLQDGECEGSWCEALSAAFGDVMEGNRLARLGDVKAATAKFASAQRTLPGLAFNPAEHAAAISSQTIAAAGRQDLHGTVTQAEVLARAARTDEARTLLERFDFASRLGNRTEILELRGREDLTAGLRELSQVAAKNGDEKSIRMLLGLMQAHDPSQNFDIEAETASLLQSVTVSHALALLQAMRVSEALDTLAKLRAARATRTPFDTEHLTANLLCWRGSLGAADLLKHPEVQNACANAVKLSEGTNSLNGHRDSRGLNRARTGDFAGAIEDFRAFAEDHLYTEDQRAPRRRWIAMLQKGEDPFTADELRKLKP